jgi:hypothetical protein
MKDGQGRNQYKTRQDGKHQYRIRQGKWGRATTRKMRAGQCRTDRDRTAEMRTEKEADVLRLFGVLWTAWTVICHSETSPVLPFVSCSYLIPEYLPYHPITLSPCHLVLLWLKLVVYGLHSSEALKKTKTKLRGRSPQPNYTDRATAPCRRS